MATGVIMFECSGCHRLISFEGEPSRFCSFCGCKLESKDIKSFIRPICPSEIPKGHCDECKKGKYKKCDDCGRTEEVEYRPQWGDKCLCRFCREREATLESLTRSW